MKSMFRDAPIGAMTVAVDVQTNKHSHHLTTDGSTFVRTPQQRNHMRAWVSRLAVTASAILGLAGVALAAPAGAAPLSSTSASSTMSGWEYAGFYDTKSQCQGGGEIYLNHGYSDYRCTYQLSNGQFLLEILD
ncbi:hypothetical protein [Saccharopolyspora sp. NPDC002578]